MYDVIIIGGGVVGCAVARELSRYRCKTLLLEKTNDICNGQSKANTAILHGGYDAKPGTLKAKFNVLGNAMFDRLHEELDVPVQWNSSLVVSFSEDGHPMLEKLLQQGIDNGCRGELRIIDREELRRREPNIGSTACEALLVGAGGIVCPYELTVAYAENAAMNGAEFQRNAEVTALKRLANGNWLVVSSIGSFETRAVVNAAGVYSDVFNNMVSARKIHIHPRRGEYYILDKPHRRGHRGQAGHPHHRRGPGQGPARGLQDLGAHPHARLYHNLLRPALHRRHRRLPARRGRGRARLLQLLRHRVPGPDLLARHRGLDRKADRGQART